MHGNAFRTSRTDRDRRHADGPVLTLVRGGADDVPAPSRVAPRAHPGVEGFTPDGDPGGSAPAAVHSSGPGASPVRRPSRGSASPDGSGTAHSGPGPNVPQAELVRRIADLLAEYDAARASADDAGDHLRTQRPVLLRRV